MTVGGLKAGDDWVLSTVVNCVHLVHAVHGGHWGGLLRFLDDLGDHRLGNAHLCGDFTVVDALFVELDHAKVTGDDVAVFGLGEVFLFGLGVEKLEADHVAFFADFKNHHGARAVGEFSGTDFQLLDEADMFILGTLAHGEDAVKEVEEALGASEVVLGDGVPGVALGRVGHDKN